MTRLDDGSVRVTFEPVEPTIPEESEPRNGWMELLRLALSTTGGQRVLMFVTVAVLIGLVAFLHDASLLVRGYLSRDPVMNEPAIASTSPLDQTSDQGGEYTPPPIPDDKTPIEVVADGAGDKTNATRETNEPETPKDIMIGDDEPSRLVLPPAVLPFLPNPNVPEDASNNHAFATSNERVDSVGFNQITPGQQAWYRRRIEVELPAYLSAVKRARTAVSSGYGSRCRWARTASTLIGQLESAKKALTKERLTDDEVARMVQSLITSRDFLLEVNRSSGLRVPVPDFWEKPNPKYARKQEQRGSDLPSVESAQLNEKGGFR